MDRLDTKAVVFSANAAHAAEQKPKKAGNKLVENQSNDTDRISFHHLIFPFPCSYTKIMIHI